MSRDIMDAANYDIETKVCECWVAITEEGEQPTGYADMPDATKVTITSWVRNVILICNSHCSTLMVITLIQTKTITMELAEILLSL